MLQTHCVTALKTFFNCLTKYCRWPQASSCERNFNLSLTQNDSVSFLRASRVRLACPLGVFILSELQKSWLKKKFRGTCRQLQYHLLMNGIVFWGDFFFQILGWFFCKSWFYLLIFFALVNLNSAYKSLNSSASDLFSTLGPSFLLIAQNTLGRSHLGR